MFYILFFEIEVILFIDTCMMQHQSSRPAGKHTVPQKRRKCVIVFDITVPVELSP